MKEEKIYEGPLKTMNVLMLVLAIIQVVICVIDLVVIWKRKVYVHLFLMWIEDVVIELPVLIIASYISTLTEGNLNLIFVITGGVLGFLIAIGDTYMETEKEPARVTVDKVEYLDD